MQAETLYWHDYETFGANPRYDRPCQFAAIRTDSELREISDPLVIYAQPIADYLPHPEACLITRITPQLTRERGIPEPQFAAQINDQLSQPGTCGVGYNSIRFDDEITRRLLFRNFYDPYAREYKNGNSRWDLIDVVRLCYALRPQGIEWPRHEDGKPSFRLEDLARANRLDHGQAHDALADVRATIALAQLLRSRQPRLYRYCYRNRGRERCSAMLDFANHEPVLHASSRYPASRGCLAVVLPLCSHPVNRRAVIGYDLSVPPGPLIELSSEAIEDRVFTPRKDLPEDVERIPLKSISTNHSPVLAPLSVLRGADLERIELDLEQCLRHRDLIIRSGDLSDKIRRVYARGAGAPAGDPEEDIYGGAFPSDKDQMTMARVRVSPAAELAELEGAFEQEKYREVLFRYRCRHYPESLDGVDAQRWIDFCRRRLLDGQPSAYERFTATLTELREERRENVEELEILDLLEDYAAELTAPLKC